MRSKWLTDCSPLSLGVVGAATDISASVSAPGTTQFPVCGFFSTFPAVRDLQATGLHRQHSVEVYTSTAYWPDDRESLNVSIKFKALNYARYKALYWTVWSSYSHCASEECNTHVSPSMCLVVVWSVDVHRRCEVWHMMSGPDSWHCPLSSILAWNLSPALVVRHLRYDDTALRSYSSTALRDKLTLIPVLELSSPDQINQGQQ